MREQLTSQKRAYVNRPRLRIRSRTKYDGSRAQQPNEIMDRFHRLIGKRLWFVLFNVASILYLGLTGRLQLSFESIVSCVVALLVMNGIALVSARNFRIGNENSEKGDSDKFWNRGGTSHRALPGRFSEDRLGDEHLPLFVFANMIVYISAKKKASAKFPKFS